MPFPLKPHSKKVAILMTTLLLFFPLAIAHADDDDDDGDVIDLLIDPTGTPVNRSLYPLPITAAFFQQNSIVSVSFSNLTEDVNIRLTNLTSTASVSLLVNPACGIYLIPVSIGPGFFRIEFQLDDGAILFGYFSCF